MLRTHLANFRTPTNRVVIQLMALMFFSSVGRGLVAPYVNLYLSELGTSGSSIGLIVGVAALVELSLSPILNNFADKYNRHRLLLIVQYGAFSLGAFMLAFSDNVFFLACIVILIELGKRSAIVLSLQLTLIRLEQINQDVLGRVRSFNAIGFSLVNFFQGIVFTLAGFMGMFFTAGFFTAFSVAFTRVLPQQISTRKKGQEIAPRQRKFYFLVLIQIFVQLGLKSGFTFWIIHFTNNVGVYVEDVGIIVALSALAEAPFLVLFDPIMRRLDVRKVFILGAGGTGLMWFLLGIAPSPGWLIPILIFRGCVFSMLLLSILVLISRISDPRNVATNQSLLQITVPGLATLFGAPLMGWIYDHYHASIYFGLCMLMMIVGALMTIVLYRVLAPNSPD